MKTQTTTEITRPVLRYQGAKFRIAPWIIGFMPPHTKYVEPFGGSATVMLRKKPAEVDVYNDINGEIVNVFRILQDEAKASGLQKRLYYTSYSRAIYEDAFKTLESDSDIVRAHKTIVRAFMGMASSSSVRGINGFHLAMNDGGRIANFNSWKNYYEHIMIFSERMRNVIIENRDWRWIIEYFDSGNTLFYCDPPYVNDSWDSKSKAYALNLKNDEHIELLDTLKKIKGMAIISGYDNELYSTVLDGWIQRSTKTMNQRGKIRQECIWLSPRAVRRNAIQNSLLSL